ncbi:MAG: response regulator [Alphaproteobacteria bacterium]|nr:response regulator [Alphaproteobacteria bacterium]
MLLVEDSWHLAQAQKSVLEGAGIDVIGPASTLEGARDFLAKCEPDLALVDLNIHGEMAYDLIETMLDRGVRVIVVTGYEILPDLENSVDAILRKPIRASQLLDTIYRVANEP